MRVIVALLCVFAQFVYSLDTTPLLLIDLYSTVHAKAPEGAPFALMSPDFIRRMLKDAARSKMVLFFIEETLCAEDLSMKDEHGTPFTFLRDHISQKLVKYYPRVSQPVELMKEMFPPNTQVRVSEMDWSVLRVLDTRPECLYVSYRDGVNEPRAKALRRHDTVMKEMYFAACRIVSGPVVAFYTGKKNPIILRTSGPPRPPIIRYSASTLEQMQAQSAMVVCPVMLYDISIWLTRYEEVPLEVPLEVVYENGTKIIKKTEPIETVQPLSQGWSCSKCLKGSVEPSETYINDNFIYAYIHKYTEGSKTWDCWTLIFAIRRTETQWILEYLTVFHRDQDAYDAPRLGHDIHFEEPVDWGYSLSYNKPLDFDANSLKMTIGRFQIEPVIENVGKEEHERRHTFGKVYKIISNMNMEKNQSEHAVGEGATVYPEGGLGKAPKIKTESPNVQGSEVFITPGILSGLLVGFILIVPLLISIQMFINLGNNNHNMRFDQRHLLRPEEVAGYG